jgi:putative hydrolase of the HAD superfamily
MDKIKVKVKQILFDADDTLWENNIHFLEANRDFFSLISKAGFKMDKIVNDFDALEKKVINERGYGSVNYIYILREIFRKYDDLSNGKLDQNRLEKIIDRFSEHPLRKPQIFENVVDTLNYLRTKYKLFILTKGDKDEQTGKIIRSQLDKAVDDYFVLPEKSDREYSEILNKFNWKADETCMVGNSPKSDINPALRNGMYAIHIPYSDTWKADIEPIIDREKKLLVLNRFDELKTVL